jgi:hypothetical protein
MIIRFNKGDKMHQLNLDQARRIEFTWKGTRIDEVKIFFAPDDTYVITGAGAHIIYEGTTRNFNSKNPKDEAFFLNPGQDG